MTEEEMKKLLEDNTALLQEINQRTLKTERYLHWLRITDILKILLIVLPLVAAWIYLPDILNSFTAGYSEVLPPGLFK